LSYNSIIRLDEGASKKIDNSSKLFNYFGYGLFLLKAELILTILAFLGLFFAQKNNKLIFNTFVSYILLYYIILGPLTGFIRQRRLLILIPALIIFSIYAIKYLHKKIKNNELKKYSLVFLAIFLINPFLIRHELLKNDSIDIARKWVENNIEENSIIIDTCATELEESLEKINYVRDYSPENITTKGTFLSNNQDLLNQGKRYFVITDLKLIDQDNKSIISDHNIYLVHCYRAINVEDDRKINSITARLENTLGHFQLEERYEFNKDLKYKGERYPYAFYWIDPLYLIKNYQHTYNDYNFTIYKIVLNK
jgi:hypothetical protein